MQASNVTLAASEVEVQRLTKATVKYLAVLRHGRMEVGMACVFSLFLLLALVLGYPVASASGILLGLYLACLVFHDLARQSDRKTIGELRKELFASAKQLEQANRCILSLSDLKDRFIATLSHELRTPLTAVQESVNLISEGISGPTTLQQQRFLEMARRNVERLTGLLNRISDLSRLQFGSMKLILVKAGLEELIQEAFNTVLPHAREKGIELSMEIKGGLPAVLADRQRVILVLVNLLDNAIKFTAGGGKAGVIAKPGANPGQVEICVWDTGIGIPKENQSHIFESFWQSDWEKSNKPPGAGLGLALSREVVTQLGGSIWVESDTGRGSRLHFTLFRYSDEFLLSTYFKSALPEACVKNSSLFQLCIRVEGSEMLHRRHRDFSMEALLREVQAMALSSSRAEDRVAMDVSRGEVHVLLIPGDMDMREFVRRLDNYLRGKSFFTGEDAMDLGFTYALASFPKHGDTLDSLRKEIDKQLLFGGMEIDDIPMKGAA